MLTVACGPRAFTEMAVDLALSLREHDGSRVTLIADEHARALALRCYPQVFEQIVRLPAGYDFGHACKFSLAEVTPYEHNLFIDADTLALSSIEPIWACAEHAGFAMMGTHRTRETDEHHHGFAIRDLIDEFALSTYFDNHSGAFYFEREHARPVLRECLDVYRALFRWRRRLRGMVGDEIAFGIVGGRRRMQRMHEPYPVLWAKELLALRPGDAPKPLCHFHAPPSEAALDWLMHEVARRRSAAGLREDSTMYWRAKAVRSLRMRRLGAALQALRSTVR